MPEERKVFLEIVSRFVVEYEPEDWEIEPEYLTSDWYHKSFLMESEAPGLHENIVRGKGPKLYDHELLERAVFVMEPDSRHETLIQRYVITEPDAKYLK